MQAGVGHYGVFNGRRWATDLPRLREFIHSHECRVVNQTVRLRSRLEAAAVIVARFVQASTLMLAAVRVHTHLEGGCMLDKTHMLFSHVKPGDTEFRSDGLRDFFKYRDLVSPKRPAARSLQQIVIANSAPERARGGTIMARISISCTMLKGWGSSCTKIRKRWWRRAIACTSARHSALSLRLFRRTWNIWKSLGRRFHCGRHRRALRRACAQTVVSRQDCARHRFDQRHRAGNCRGTRRGRCKYRFERHGVACGRGIHARQTRQRSRRHRSAIAMPT